MFLATAAFGQNPKRDTLDLTAIKADSTLLMTENDTARIDSSGVTRSNNDLSRVKLSKDTIESIVDYSATDSMIYDIANKKIYLFGSADAKYQTMSITAGKITMAWDSTTLLAEGFPDSTGHLSQFPKFKDGDQTFDSKRMRYNFKSRKGLVYQVSTKHEELFLHGEKAKFISARGDSTTNDIIYNKNAIFTSCDAPVPHFGIRSQKQKVIPGKMVIIGPSHLEIMGIPTPLWLPFGFFPVTKGAHSGLLFPKTFEQSDEWGFGLRNIGWYFPISDHVDLKLTGDIYFNGTWGLHSDIRYKKRYKYNGSLALGYSHRVTEVRGEKAISKPFSIVWSHSQDPKANPSHSFSGSVNITTGSYDRKVNNDYRSTTNKSLSSNLTYRMPFPGKPFSFTASMSHSQTEAPNPNRNDILHPNITTMTIKLPTLDFRTQTLYPFKRKKKAGKEKWYETTTLTYSGQARNEMKTVDTLLFTKQTLTNARFGAKHDISMGNSLKFLKYFSFNPKANYRERWEFKSIDKEFHPEDTTVVRDTVTGMKTWRTFDMGAGVNTKVYGTLLFKKGWLRGFRHVATPNVSFNYSPDFTLPRWGYFDSVQVDESGKKDLYSHFENGVYGSPTRSGKQMAVKFSISNNLEAKVFSKRDSTFKKIKILKSFSVSTSYNFAKDSLNWSTLSFSGNTSLFRGLTNLSFGASWDPYATDESGKKINTFYKQTSGKLLRFLGGRAGFTTSFTIKKLRELFSKKEDKSKSNKSAQKDKSNKKNNTPADFFSFFDNLNFSHNLDLNYNPVENALTGAIKDTLVVRSHRLTVRGAIKLTDNWNVNISNIGYDFIGKEVIYPDLGFSRDLHCWEMSFSWQPQRGTYNFMIRVKPSALDFLKVPVRKNNADALGGF